MPNMDASYANESEDCFCGIDNFHKVKHDQSVEEVYMYILDSYQMMHDEEHKEVVVGMVLTV